MAPNQYVEKHNLVVKAMRKVDPAIKVIASSATPEETSWCYIENLQFGTFQGRERLNVKMPFAFGSNQDWTGAFLQHSADYIDYLGEHFYGYPNLAIDAATQQFVEANDALTDKVRRLSNKVEFKFEAWNEYVKKMPYLQAKDIKFAFDEWSPRNRSVTPGAAPAAGNPMLNPLTNALVYHEFFRHSDKVGLAVATGGMGTVASDANGDAIGLRMEGQVMKVLHDHFAGALPVAVGGSSPQLPTKGVVAIDNSARPSGSPTYPLDVFAALSADRRKIAISVINPTEAPQDCELNLTGVQANGPVTVLQLVAPADVAAAPTAAGPVRMFGGPPVTAAGSTLPQAPRRVTLPPASITVYQFEVR
jgi:alpha-N-arabinofuranosidase